LKPSSYAGEAPMRLALFALAAIVAGVIILGIKFDVVLQGQSL